MTLKRKSYRLRAMDTATIQSLVMGMLGVFVMGFVFGRATKP